MITKCCADGQVHKPLTDFYAQRCHSHGRMSCCKKCFNVRCQQRWRKRKLETLAEMGNCCADCGLRVEARHYAVFGFHHLDPACKDADWSQLRWLGRARIRVELA